VRRRAVNVSDVNLAIRGLTSWQVGRIALELKRSARDVGLAHVSALSKREVGNLVELTFADAVCAVAAASRAQRDAVQSQTESRRVRSTEVCGWDRRKTQVARAV